GSEPRGDVSCAEARRAGDWRAAAEVGFVQIASTAPDALVEKVHQRFGELPRVGKRDVTGRQDLIEIAQKRRLERGLFPDGKENGDFVSAEDVIGDFEGPALAGARPDDDHRLRLVQELDARRTKVLRRKRATGIQFELGTESLAALGAIARQKVQAVWSAIDLSERVEYALHHRLLPVTRPGQRLTDEQPERSCNALDPGGLWNRRI